MVTVSVAVSGGQISAGPAADARVGAVVDLRVLARQPTPTTSPADLSATSSASATTGRSEPTTTSGERPRESSTTVSTRTSATSPTATESTEPPATSTSTAVSPAAVRPATPPAAVDQSRSPALIAVAVVVLVVASLLVVRLFRTTRRSPAHPDQEAAPAAPSGPETPSAEAVLLMAAIGEAMLDAGYDVGSVRSALVDVAVVNGMPRAEIITMPTAMFVSAHVDGRLETGAVATGSTALRLHQIEDLERVVTAARHGRIEPAQARDRIAEIRRLPPLFGPVQRVVGNALAAAGLAVLLGGSWTGIAVAAVLGGVVGVLLLVEVSQRFQVLLNVAAAFVVALSVFLLARTGLDVGALPVGPDRSTGDAAARGAADHRGHRAVDRPDGVGCRTHRGRDDAAGDARIRDHGRGCAVGDTCGSPAGGSVGWFGPWVAIAVFGVGIMANRCVHPRSLGWVLLVLYVAYAAQVAGDVAFGGVLSAFFGALAMTPVAALVSRQRTGPPAVVSFLPAYWLLVPGALGLVGVATLLDGDTNGLDTLLTTTTTMVAISLGVLVGLATGHARAAGSLTPS